MRKTASCKRRCRQAARRGEHRVDGHARHQRARAAVPVGDDAEEKAAGRGGEERDRADGAGRLPRDPEVRDDRREQQRVEHHVEGVEHPAERRGDERALRVRRPVAPPPKEPGPGRCRRDGAAADVMRDRPEDGTRGPTTPRCSRPCAQQTRQLGGAGRVTVDAQRVDRERQRRAIRRRHLSVGHHAQRATDDLLGVVNDRAGRGPRRKRSVWRVGAVGKPFRRDAKTGRLPAARSSEPGRPKSTSDRSKARTARAMASASVAIAGRHVVERAMRLHMGKRDTFRTPRSPPARRSGRAPCPRPHEATRAARAGRTPRGREIPDAPRRRPRPRAPAGPSAASRRGRRRESHRRRWRK